MRNNNRDYFLRKLAIPLTSLVIVTFLVLQTVAGFGGLILGSPPPSSYMYLLHSPWSWPFLDYPMYAPPRYEGESIDQYFVFGTLEDSSEVPIRPDDLGLDFWLFSGITQGIGVVPALLRHDTKRIQDYIDLYRSRHNKRLVALRLENHPLILLRGGVKPGTPQVLKTFRFESIEQEK
jgi:hypothetical protein